MPLASFQIVKHVKGKTTNNVVVAKNVVECYKHLVEDGNLVAGKPCVLAESICLKDQPPILRVRTEDDNEVVLAFTITRAWPHEDMCRSCVDKTIPYAKLKNYCDVCGHTICKEAYAHILPEKESENAKKENETTPTTTPPLVQQEDDQAWYI